MAHRPLRAQRRVRKIENVVKGLQAKTASPRNPLSRRPVGKEIQSNRSSCSVSWEMDSRGIADCGSANTIKPYYDQAIYQAANPSEGETKCDAELKEKMSEDSVLCEIVSLYEKAAPADTTLVGKKKKGPKGGKSAAPRFVHNAMFKRRYGIVTKKTKVMAQKPTEKGEYIKGKVDKSWSPAEALAEWNREIQGKTTADYKGRQGSARYWLDLDEVRQIEIEEYIDGAVEQFSDVVKNAKESQIVAMKKFAHSSNAGIDDTFFEGIHGQSASSSHDPSQSIARILGITNTPLDDAAATEESAATEVLGGRNIGSGRSLPLSSHPAPPPPYLAHSAWSPPYAAPPPFHLVPFSFKSIKSILILSGIIAM